MKKLSLICLFTLLFGIVLLGQTNNFPPHGNVGIGIFNGVSLLHLQGVNEVNANLRIEKFNLALQTGMTYEFSNEGSKLFLRSKSWSSLPIPTLLEDFIAFDGGNKRVGLNVNNPLSTFQIGDRYSLVESRNSEKAITYNAYSNSTTGYYKLIQGNSTAVRFTSEGKLLLSYNTDPGLSGTPITWRDAITILNSGYVGISNSNPSVALDVTGKTKTTSFQLPTLAGTGKVLTSTDVYGNATWTPQSSLDDGDWSKGTNIVWTNKNVGIGINPPIFPLHVQGNVKLNSDLITDGKVIIGEANYGGTKDNEETVSDPQFEVRSIFEANRKIANFVDNDGDGRRIFFVTKLGSSGYNAISSENDAGIFFSDALDDTGTGNEIAGLVIGPQTPYGDMISRGIKIDKDGNVGIGKQPETTLDVNGDITAQNLFITTKILAAEVQISEMDEWKDYVFEDNYNLMDLSEVEKYINANKHLPDVPSESEVLSNGINVGEMNAVLLQKIEELTLYLIQQQKEIDELKSQISGQ